jgi:hypothetical protein
MARLIRMQEREVEDHIVEQEKLFQVYVFGLPRSGTSMMTRILELLGVKMFYTSEDKKEETDERFKERFGEYHANPTGFYEVTQDFFLHYIRILSTPYAGCKMIAPVRGPRWDLVKSFPSKVILMLRDPEEIRQSQMAYYSDEDVDTAAIKTTLVQEKVKLKRHNIPFLAVEYRQVLEDKAYMVKQIAEFIQSDVDPQAAIDFINPKQNRFKAEELEAGI